ncbi:MAG: hypothetical protein WBD99_08735 [Thermodesulfobacteriota bacterium]
MGKYLFIILIGLFFMVGFVMSASQADAFKGAFEGPMAYEGGQMEGSEGKIGDMGEFMVEIPGVPVGQYDVCLCYYNELGGAAMVMEMHLQTVRVADEDTGFGELKSHGGPGSIGEGTFFGPFFKVYNVGCQDCTPGMCSDDEDNMVMFETAIMIGLTDS